MDYDVEADMARYFDFEDASNQPSAELVTSESSPTAVTPAR
jgi:hypothetical protein